MPRKHRGFYYPLIVMIGKKLQRDEYKSKTAHFKISHMYIIFHMQYHHDLYLTYYCSQDHQRVKGLFQQLLLLSNFYNIHFHCFELERLVVSFNMFIRFVYKK